MYSKRSLAWLFPNAWLDCVGIADEKIKTKNIGQKKYIQKNNIFLYYYYLTKSLFVRIQLKSIYSRANTNLSGKSFKSPLIRGISYLDNRDAPVYLVNLSPR